MSHISRYLIAIDIGNSSTSVGIFKSGRLIKFLYGKVDHFPKIYSFLSRNGVNSSFQVIIDSVNPSQLQKVKRTLKKRFPSIKPIVIGENLIVRIPNRYKNYAKLGKDRVVNIFGALRLYSRPFLVIDLGTATTVDYVSRQGIFEGGLIIPGFEVSWRALEEKASLLPRLRTIGQVRKLFGNDTASCMRAGCLQGFGSMIDGLIERFQRLTGKRLTVIATGGYSKLISSYMKSKMIVDPYHTLRSLEIIYRELLKGGHAYVKR